MWILINALLPFEAHKLIYWLINLFIYLYVSLRLWHIFYWAVINAASGHCPLGQFNIILSQQQQGAAKMCEMFEMCTDEIVSLNENGSDWLARNKCYILCPNIVLMFCNLIFLKKHDFNLVYFSDFQPNLTWIHFFRLSNLYFVIYTAILNIFWSTVSFVVQCFSFFQKKICEKKFLCPSCPQEKSVKKWWCCLILHTSKVQSNV